MAEQQPTESKTCPTCKGSRGKPVMDTSHVNFDKPLVGKNAPKTVFQKCTNCNGTGEV